MNARCCVFSGWGAALILGIALERIFNGQGKRKEKETDTIWGQKMALEGMCLITIA
jgi:hypothetical protein